MIRELTKPLWSIENFGGKVYIDDYTNFPTGTVAVVDIETNEGEGDEFRIVCIGICCDGVQCHIFFDIRPALLVYLQNIRIVAHSGKGAEIAWLEKYGIKIEQLEYDTQVGYYVFDSTRKNYALKKILKDKFNVEYPTYVDMVTNKEFIERACIENDLWEFDSKGNQKLPKRLTLDKMSKEIVAEYNAADVFHTHKLWTWLRQNMSVTQKNFFETIELPMNKLIFEMEKKGVKIDTKEVHKIHNETSKKRRKAKSKLFTLAGGLFNPNSPKQVLPILRKAGADVDATDEDTISRFKTIPIVETLLDYRGLQKVCSTYTTPLYFNAVKDSEHRIHARFSQNTVTGRLSSSDPINLQNQPKEVRSCFIAKDGYNLIGADWSNIELRIPAHFSNEPGFIQELSNNGDLHIRTATFLFGSKFTGELAEDKRKEMRQKAKTCNFLLTNSGTSKRLATELQCSNEESEKLYGSFWQGYPTLAAWLKQEKEIARKNGGVTTMFGRWVPIPQLALTCGNWNCAKSNRFCRQCFLREEAERQAISVLVQGSASDLMKLSAIRLKNEYGLIPILSVHDELVYEIKESKCNETQQMIRNVMENITTLKVPLKVDIKTGKNWKDAH